LGGDRFVRVAAIAAPVSAPNVIDDRFRRFVLHLERGDQGVLCGHGHALCFAGYIYANREFERHIGVFLPASRRSDYELVRCGMPNNIPATPGFAFRT
jgi:hypothetical protein